MATIGKLRVDITANPVQFRQGMTGAGQVVSDFRNKVRIMKNDAVSGFEAIDATVTKLWLTLKLGIGVVSAVGSALGRFASKIFRLFAKIIKSPFVIAGGVAAIIGSAAAIAKMRRVTRDILKLARASELLGVTVEDVQAWRRAVELAGGRAAAVTAEDLARARAELRETGAVLTEEDVANAKRFNDSMKRLSQLWESIFQQIVIELGPAFADLLDALIAFAKATAILEKLAFVLNVVAEVMQFVVEVLEEVGGFVGGLFGIEAEKAEARSRRAERETLERFRTAVRMPAAPVGVGRELDVMRLIVPGVRRAGRREDRALKQREEANRLLKSIVRGVERIDLTAR